MNHYRDPDYESYNSAVELNEEEDKKENLIKIRKIIEEEYNKEILQRQDQIEQIELQICKVRKLLHLLRYALIMSYYKKKELEYSGNEEDPSTSDTLVMPDKQNRIHPAVKKLLGKNVNSLDHLAVKDKRKSTSRHNLTHKLSEVATPPETKKIKLELDPQVQTVTEVPVVNQQESIRSRKRTKHRVVVGNISKWMPSSEEDILTHKWMVYVRGPKDHPDVSHFIDKVVYYLHPSYKPHDVVEVSESPFHLSRRGWGEFPVRVQIFFKVTLNKPIDVVHNIKLDKTYSGRQTLGNETIVDVFLYDEKIDDEHDYCTEVTDSEGPFDHCYSLPEGFAKSKSEPVEQDESNKLIYGLDGYYEDKVVTHNNFKQLIQLNRKDIKFNNTKIIVFGKKMEGAFLTNFGKFIQTPVMKNEGKNKVSLPKNKLKSMGEVLPYLFKRLPLYSDQANNSNYKRLYPFTASSLKEFVSWNVGKRRSSEWSRAKTIKKIVRNEKIPDFDKWNTKAILMYARSHDYTPFISYGLFSRDSEEKNLLSTCYSHQRVRTFVCHKPEDVDVDINVVSDTEIATPKTVIDMTDPRLECSYIRQAALNCGIILKPEEIMEGVKVNAAELMILEAVKCLAENLIRRAKNHRVCTKPLSCNTISKEDVMVAINERPEMVFLRHFESRNEYL